MIKSNLLKFKIIASIFAVLAIAILIIGYISIQTSDEIISTMAKKMLIANSKNISEEIFNDIKQVEKSVNLMGSFVLDATAIQTQKDLEKLKNLAYLESQYSNIRIYPKELGKNTKWCMSTYFYYNHDYAGDYDGAWFVDKGKGFNRIILNSTIEQEDSPWYFLPVAAKKGLWSEPYKDPDLKKDMITYSVPVYRNQMLIGVAGMDITLDELNKILKSIKIYKTTDAFIVDSNYNFIAGDLFEVGSNLLKERNGFYKFLKVSSDKKEGFVEYKDNGTQKIISYITLPNGFILIIRVPISEILAEMNNMTYLMIFAIIFIIFSATFAAFRIGEKISASIISTLLESKTQLQAILDNMPFSSWLKDSDGKFIAVNKPFADFYNLSPEKLLGKTDFDIKPEETAKANWNKEQEIMNSELPYFEEIHINTSEGNKCFEIFETPIFNKKGEVTGITGLAKDITDRKQAEEEIIAAKELAELANKVKGEFLANMSHEIRTPMNGVIGFLQLLSETELDEEQADFASEAKKSSECLLSIINDILDFSKIEAGKMLMENISFDIRSVVEDAAVLSTTNAHQRGLEINALIHSDVPQRVFGDPTRLKQVLNNLINNAVKFTKEGEINITVKLASKSNDSVIINFDVTDTGIGITEEAQQKIFESFTQADASATRKFGGTGLGLAICKKIVDMMNGNISVKSEKGKGATFSFTAKFTEDKKISITKMHNDSIRGIKVLVIDDNLTNLKIMRYYLEEAGCIVCEATSADEAMSVLKTETDVKVAVVDFYMPKTDGFELGSLIKSNSEYKDISLVMLTSIAKRGNSTEAKERGFTGYLTKPVKKKDILQCISLIIDSKENENNENDDVLITRHTIKENKFNDKVKILLVEDNEINQKLTSKILSIAGFNCDIAENGALAVKSYQNKSYDIILMDCQMPVMNGFEATKEIRAIENSLKENENIEKHVPIIALTANVMEDAGEDCINSGMDDYLTKPIDSNNLIEVVTKYLNLNSEETAEYSNIPESEVINSVNLISNIIKAIVNDHGFTKDEAEEFLGEYLTLLPSNVSKLKEAIQQVDFTSIITIAHTLKGSSGNLRMYKLMEIAVDLEKASRANEESLCRKYIKDIEGYLLTLQDLNTVCAE
ncbi:MAG: response regulator [Candidatus Gastranaerophilales bacterium]|nr:response regulator [Candidatus Gastranaerophilales bacterium]